MEKEPSFNINVKIKRFPINKSCFIDFLLNALQLIQLTTFPNVIIPSHSPTRKTKIKKKGNEKMENILQSVAFHLDPIHFSG